MTVAERIYGGASQVAQTSRTDDSIDDRWIGYEWRRLTEPAARRSARYDTAKFAAFTWLFMDRHAEWSRHRGAAVSFQ